MTACTCAGTAPGYPQHEWWCGLPEREDDCICGAIFIDPECVEHGHLARVPDEDVAAA